MMLHYKNAVSVFEGSWDLPRSFQDLEIFGSTHRTGRQPQPRQHLYDAAESGAAQWTRNQGSAAYGAASREGRPNRFHGGRHQE